MKLGNDLIWKVKFPQTFLYLITKITNTFIKVNLVLRQCALHRESSVLYKPQGGERLLQGEFMDIDWMGRMEGPCRPSNDLAFVPNEMGSFLNFLSWDII